MNTRKLISQFYFAVKLQGASSKLELEGITPGNLCSNLAFAVNEINAESDGHVATNVPQVSNMIVREEAQIP